MGATRGFESICHCLCVRETMRTGDAGPTVAQRQHGHKQNTERRWTRRTLRPATRLLHRQHPSNSGTRALAHSSAQRDVYASPLSRGSGTASQQCPTRFASNPHPRRAGITYARASGGESDSSAVSPSLISICVRGYSGAAPPPARLASLPFVLSHLLTHRPLTAAPRPCLSLSLVLPRVAWSIRALRQLSIRTCGSPSSSHPPLSH